MYFVQLKKLRGKFCIIENSGINVECRLNTGDIYGIFFNINIQLSKEQLFENQRPCPLCFIAFGGGLRIQQPSLQGSEALIMIYYLVTQFGARIDHLNHSVEAVMKSVLLPKDLTPMLA